MGKKIVLGVDHGALDLKQILVSHLQGRGFEVKDMGVFTNDSVDYPDKAVETVREFKRGEYECGIVCCGTGIGVSVSANKHRGIICALPQNSFAARMAKEHNNANFIAFGGRIDYQEPVEKILDAYLDANFAGGRHSRRVEKMLDLDNSENLNT